MALYTGYVAAQNHCTGYAQPGAKELMSWFLGAYKDQGARNDGIYNCRPVRGGTQPSLHGEGRACDLGCQIGDVWAQNLANWLVAHSKELGVQCVIFNHRIWSGQYPLQGWRNYTGIDQHTTHLHVELSWASARSLTVERIKAVQAVAPKAPKRMYLSRVLQRGSSGLAVMNLQKEFTRRGHYLLADGDYGQNTYDAVRKFQRKHDLPVDGKVGPKTAAALGWVWRG